MTKYIIFLLSIINLTYPYGIKRSIDANIHKTVTIGIFGADDVESITFGVGMHLPLSGLLGLNFGVCGLSIGGEDVYTPLLVGEVGLSEMLSTKYISLFSTQNLQPGLYKKDQENKLSFSLNASVGLELFSGYSINPYFEAGFLVGYEQFALRGGAGLKYSF